jgi:hypothetical protein
VVQEFIDGRTPPRLDDVVAEQMTRILGLQEAMFPGASDGWGQWAAGVVFEDCDGLRGRITSGVPGGSRIVAAVDAIAGACQPGPLSGLVHGNFNLANTIATPCGPGNGACPERSPVPRQRMITDPRHGAGQLTSCIGPHAARTIWLWGLTRPRSRACAR